MYMYYEIKITKVFWSLVLAGEKISWMGEQVPQCLLKPWWWMAVAFSLLARIWGEGHSFPTCTSLFIYFWVEISSCASTFLGQDQSTVAQRAKTECSLMSCVWACPPARFPQYALDESFFAFTHTQITGSLSKDYWGYTVHTSLEKKVYLKTLHIALYCQKKRHFFTYFVYFDPFSYSLKKVTSYKIFCYLSKCGGLPILWWHISYTWLRIHLSADTFSCFVCLCLSVDDDEHDWIVKTCRKGWDEYVGYTHKPAA